MNKIINIDQAVTISKTLRSQGKTLVLAGGCFDILHIGHITFLEKAKMSGDLLFILLESDESIKKIKGESRPINTQEDRAKILASLQSVDYIICLKPNLTDQDYGKIIRNLKPSIIATTKGDSNKKQKERQAALINCKVVDVVHMIKDKSTTRLINILGEEL